MNKDWKDEQERLNNVLKEIQKKEEKIKRHAGDIRDAILGIRENFWDDVTINFDEPDDIGETFTSIKQQKEMLSERERSHRQLYKQLENFKKLKKSTYFGRVDFKEAGERNAERIYLGISSVMDENEEEFLVYDWRAPISSIYYDFSPGPAHYETEYETINGEMELKRQFIIRDGKIRSMFDTGVTIGDELLQEVLGNNASTQMKSIVATIQKEQNQIIRNERKKFLIVQGVAGSGKTSAALQRVAYILYRYRNKINAENILLFSPNSLFNSYIATVLPELGEDNMEQTTFQSYIEKRLGKQFQLEDGFSQMEYTLTAMGEIGYDERISAIRFKASLKFKEYLDAYIESLSNNNMIFKNIRFRGEVLITSTEINDYFYSIEKYIPIPKRMITTARWILEQLSSFERKERNKEWVLEESELLDEEEYLKVHQYLQNKRPNEDRFDDYEKAEKILRKKVVKEYFRPIRRAVKRLKFLNMKEIYRQLFSNPEITGRYEQLPDGWDAICLATLEKLGKSELFYEDTTPFLYLQDQLEGRKPNMQIRHLFIDEAQDYSPFQFAYLKQLFPASRMTILGDFNQGIYTHAQDSETLLTEDLYEEGEQDKIVLTRSYRSTKEIVEFSRNLIKNGEEIEPFNRSGNKPTISIINNKEIRNNHVIEKVLELQENDMKTIAIICKTASESKEAYEKLNKHLNLKLMNKETNTFENGILILPAYLAKGIEFDAVIIFNCSDQDYGRENERKLFYTACTRAMHELHLYSIGDKSKFLDSVNKELYELYNT